MASNIHIGIENSQQFYHDALPLFQKEWDETQEEKSNVSIDLGYYLQQEAMQNLIILAARHEYRLVGFLVFVGVKSVHNNELCAKSAGFYVEKDYRKKGVGLDLIRKAKEIIKPLGYSMSMDTYMKNDISKILEHCGGKLESKTYVF